MVRYVTSFHYDRTFRTLHFIEMISHRDPPQLQRRVIRRKKAMVVNHVRSTFLKPPTAETLFSHSDEFSRRSNGGDCAPSTGTRQRAPRAQLLSTGKGALHRSNNDLTILHCNLNRVNETTKS